jgi:hypothetical protein
LCQELNSQCSAEDDDEGEGEVGEVDVAVGFGADVEAFEASEPGVGAFDDPAVACVGVAGAGDWFAAAFSRSCCLAGWVAGAAAFADLGCDAAGADLFA